MQLALSSTQKHFRKAQGIRDLETLDLNKRRECQMSSTTGQSGSYCAAVVVPSVQVLSHCVRSPQRAITSHFDHFSGFTVPIRNFCACVCHVFSDGEHGAGPDDAAAARRRGDGSGGSACLYPFTDDIKWSGLWADAAVCPPSPRRRAGDGGPARPRHGARGLDDAAPPWYSCDR